MFYRILTLIYKEFLAVWRDKKSRIILISPPLMQLFVFALAATLDVKNVSLGILNKDCGEKGIELQERFYGSNIFKHIVFLKKEEEIAPFIDNQKGLFVLSIDEKFSRNIDQKKRATVQLILDGRKSNAAQITLGYVASVINQYSQELMGEKIHVKTIELVSRNWFNPNLIYPWFTISGLLGILTMVEALIIVGLSVARERELGTFDQLLVSPLLATEILIGKTIPAVIISIGEGTLILLAGIFIFRIPFEGSLFLLYIAMFVFVLSIIGVGLFFSAISKTQQQAILGAFVFMTPAILISGFATPVENMPTWLQYVSYADPLRYFLVIARGVFLKSMGFKMVWQNIWPMIIIASFTLPAAAFFFRRRLE